MPVEPDASFERVVDWAGGFKGFQCHVELKEVPGGLLGTMPSITPLLLPFISVQSCSNVLLVDSSLIQRPRSWTRTSHHISGQGTSPSPDTPRSD